MDEQDIDPKESGDGEEMPENIDELLLSEMDDTEDADEEGFGGRAFSSY